MQKILNPWVFAIAAVVIVLLIVLKFSFKKEALKDQRKVANTASVEDTPYYKKLKRKYNIYRCISLSSLLVAMAAAFVMLSRPVTVDVVNPTVHNRDIFLCLDISDSVDEVSLELCDELKKIVAGLDGERFGITMFNARSVLLVPLTTDYSYVNEELDLLKKVFKQNIKLAENDYYPTADFDWYLYNYKYEGTLCDYGSSFIGDGLASCLYSFPDLEKNKDRTRIIIFATDNDLNGTPIISVEDACALCAKNNVKVYAIAPNNVVDEDTFKQSIESTGGEYYRAKDKSMIKGIVSSIEATEASELEDPKIIITDQPVIMFIIILVAVAISFITGRRIRL